MRGPTYEGGGVMRFKGMNRSALFALVAAFGLAACSESPAGPDVTASVGDPELEVAADVDLAESAVQDAEISLSVSGPPSPEVQDLIDQARAKWKEAREAFAAGDKELARELADEARMLLAEALITARGEEVIDAMLARLDNIIERLAEPAEHYDRPAELKAILETCADEAQALADAGDTIGAGAQLIYCLQLADRARLRFRDMVRDRINHARLAVARGHEAVGLATRMLGDSPTQTQMDLLTAAEALQRTAEAALGQGSPRRAAALAHRAESTALAAVVDIDGVSPEEARAILDADEALIAAAEAAIGPDPTPQQRALLAIAVRLHDAGLRVLSSSDRGRRGVGLLWHSAVTAAILVGD